MTKTKFIPYADESAVLNIGRLAVENRLDRVSLSGDVDLTADQAGLAYARQLQQLINDVVAHLESQTLSAKLAPAAVKTVANPFE